MNVKYGLLVYLLLTVIGSCQSPNNRTDELDLSWMANELQLSDQQREAFDQIIGAFHEEAIPLLKNQRDTKNRIYQLLSEDPSFTAEVGKLATSLGPTSVTLQEHLIDLYLGLISICEEDQKAKLFPLFTRLSL